MEFFVLPVGGQPPTTARSQSFLRTDNWDDFNYQTLYWLTYVDELGEPHGIGGVKIANFGRGTETGRPELPSGFEALGDEFFSLGQGDEYYVSLNVLPDDTRLEILASLNDVAADLSLFNRAQDERVTDKSLLRQVTPTEVKGQLHRLAGGGVRLTEYSFSYRRPNPDDVPPVSFEFDVIPDSQPPTNIHVIVGSNGVGKTRLLNEMALALVDPASVPENSAGRFVFADGPPKPKQDFAGLVYVSFSAFDSKTSLANATGVRPDFRYAYVGILESGTESSDHELKSDRTQPAALRRDFATEFVRSLEQCRQGPRRSRWERALATLETDPIFQAAEVSGIVDQTASKATEAFLSLSSGHAIVLFTMTRLVETVEEKSVVVIDEPEAHLHPPLLSAFVRSLSNLLVDRNGVAILATHSPVVLQEVPRSCVWKVRRIGSVTLIGRPDIETFGENVGVLTHEVFGLEVTDSGFHHLLARAVRERGSYEAVLGAFGGQLGGEARALVRAMVASTAADARRSD